MKTLSLVQSSMVKPSTVSWDTRQVGMFTYLAKQIMGTGLINNAAHMISKLYKLY